MNVIFLISRLRRLDKKVIFREPIASCDFWTKIKEFLYFSTIVASVAAFGGEILRNLCGLNERNCPKKTANKMTTLLGACQKMSPNDKVIWVCFNFTRSSTFTWKSSNNSQLFVQFWRPKITLARTPMLPLLNLPILASWVSPLHAKDKLNYYNIAILRMGICG